MTNRDLLKEAIADAKAVKEVAITNAKAALEEAFTPHLKEMFEKKLSEMEEEDDLKEYDELQPDRDMDGDGDVDAEDVKAMSEAELEELLKELDEAEEEETEEESEESEEEGEEEGEEEEVEIDLEEMTEEDLKKFIEEVVDEMIEAGELEAGHEGMEDEAGAEMEEPEMGAEEEVSAEETPMMEGKESIEEMDMSVDIVDAIVATLGTLGGIIGGGFAKASYDEKKAAAKKIAQAAAKADKGEMAEDYEQKETEKMRAMESELAEAIETISTLKSELHEINLLNSKLLYTNKIFKAKNLSEAQKVKVLTAFDKAETVKEVKLVFETLNEGLEKAAKKELVRESKGFASKPVGASPKQPVVDVNPVFERMKKLAGL